MSETAFAGRFMHTESMKNSVTPRATRDKESTAESGRSKLVKREKPDVDRRMPANRDDRVSSLGQGVSSIEDLQIGSKLRHARMVQRYRLKDLAVRVGCSESMLSKVENDQVKPSLKILHRLAAELNTSIGALFSRGDGERNNVVMRRNERPIIRTDVIGRSTAAGVKLECLVPNPEDRLLYGSIHIVEPGGGSEGEIQHKGEEIGYVLEGELDLTVDGTTYRLLAHDSFFFDSSLPHGYRNPGKITTKVVWINTPPTF